MKPPKIEKKLALLVTLHFLGSLFLIIGIAASLAFILTAKWYMVGVAFATCVGAWFILYKFEEGVTAREKSQDATITAPDKANFNWKPGLK
jgi:hypothetical protein